MTEIAGDILAHLIRYSLYYVEAALLMVLALRVRATAQRPRPKWPALEAAFASLARRRALAVAVVAASALSGRLALTPLLPEREPSITDEFSYLLAAKTFAAGRLTNPAHPMWTHFETMHVNQQPTYMSMYPPAQGLFMAAGERLTGHPIVGVWFSSALMCAALCWMLQAWMPPVWALLGGLAAVARFGLFSYWANSYWGGAVAALGGALLLGALPRIMKRRRVRDSMWLGLGVAILANSRPYEGALLCLPAALWLAAWLFRERRWKERVTWTRAVLPCTLVLGLAAAATGYYNWRLTGDPAKLPYQVNRDAYPGGRYFVWEAERPQASYRHASMRAFYEDWQAQRAKAAAGAAGFLKTSLEHVGQFWLFYLGPALTLPLAMLPAVWRDRRMRALAVMAVVCGAGWAANLWFYAHYAAPALALVWVFVFQSLRRLRTVGVRGRALARGVIAACVVMAGLRLAAQPMAGMLAPDHPATWYNTQPGGVERAAVARKLAAEPGRHLVLVRYTPEHNWFDEWVYNEPDIDASRLVWAHDMGEVANRDLLTYYRGRKVWLLEADAKPPALTALE